jgi:hypothetical protein
VWLINRRVKSHNGTFCRVNNSVRHIAVRLGYDVLRAPWKHSIELVMYGSTAFLLVAFVNVSVKASNFASKHADVEKMA